MIYCFDLDGTLCNTKGNNYAESSPKKDRIQVVSNRIHHPSQSAYYAT